MPIHSLAGVTPRLGQAVFLSPTAHLVGDVAVGDDASFWFHTAARGDVHSIRVGARTNIQDGVVLHVTHETHPLVIGSDVVVGHAAVLHGCTVEDGALIGIGARVLDGAVVESGAQVGAGALVPPGMRVPAGQLVLGVPARVVRPLTVPEARTIGAIAARYVDLKNRYLSALGTPPVEEA